MSTITGNKRRAILLGLLGAVAAAGVARADVASDKPGAILILPKIVVDTHAVFGSITDTEIQVTNTSNAVIAARCWIVDATSFCSNKPATACLDNTDCPPGGVCKPQWIETDFRMTLTKRQPVTWKASQGRTDSLSSVPGVQTDPFFGYMKCVEVDPDDFKPTCGFDLANHFEGDLKGEVTIVRTERHNTDGSNTTDLQTDGPNTVDAQKYNAVGIQARAAAVDGRNCTNDRDDVLCLGGAETPTTLCPQEEYNACPNVIIVNNIFDDATVVTRPGGPDRERLYADVVSDLTVVPCGDNFYDQKPLTSTLQFLVYNEFEQRFSTSTSVTCFRETQLSDIDTRPGSFGNPQSIFNVGVQGTIAGQFRIRPVTGPNSGLPTGTYANKVIAVLHEFWECDPEAHPYGVCSAAVNTNFVGTNKLGDVMLLSPDVP